MLHIRVLHMATDVYASLGYRFLIVMSGYHAWCCGYYAMDREGAISLVVVHLLMIFQNVPSPST